MSTGLEAETGVGAGYDVGLAIEIGFRDGEGDEEIREDGCERAVGC